MLRDSSFKEFIDNTWIELEVCSLAQVASFYWFWWSMKVTFYKFFTSLCSVVKGMENLGVDTNQKIFTNFMQLSIVKVVEECCLSSRVQGCQGALGFFFSLLRNFLRLLQRRHSRFYATILSYLCSLHAYSGGFWGILRRRRKSEEKSFLMNLNEF